MTGRLIFKPSQWSALNGRHIYVAQFECGTIKVGSTKQPKVRRLTLNNRSPYQVSNPVRWFVSNPCRDAGLELGVIHSVSEFAVPVAGRREWFQGADFDRVASLCSMLVAAAINDERRREDERALKLHKRVMRRKVNK